MDRRYFLAKLKGADDLSGIVLPDIGDRAAALRRAAELLSHLNAAPVGDGDIDLIPYFPPQRERIDLRPNTEAAAGANLLTP